MLPQPTIHRSAWKANSPKFVLWAWSRSCCAGSSLRPRSRRLATLPPQRIRPGRRSSSVRPGTSSRSRSAPLKASPRTQPRGCRLTVTTGAGRGKIPAGAQRGGPWPTKTHSSSKLTNGELCFRADTGIPPSLCQIVFIPRESVLQRELYNPEDLEIGI
jgi:hypothetical protein